LHGHWLTTILLLVSVVSPLPAQTAEAIQPENRAEQYLNAPDRHDISWKVEISGPVLTYDLRYLVTLRVEVPERDLIKRDQRSDLNLLIKAGDERQWYPEQDFTHFPLPALQNNNIIKFSGTAYLRPGRHRFAFVLCDNTCNLRSITRRSVTVPSHTLLAELDRGMPAVEFIAAFGEDSPIAVRASRKISRSEMQTLGMEAKDMLARTPVLPAVRLQDQRPLEIHVLADFTPSSEAEASSHAYARSEAAMWGILRVLSRLQPERGCVLLSAIDVIGIRVLFDSVDASTADWHDLAEKLLKVDSFAVNIRALEAHKRMAEFFRSQLSRLISSRSACKGSLGAERVYIIAAEGVLFPYGSDRVQIEPPAEGAGKVYYLRVGRPWDEMERIVQPLNPRHLNADTPEKFRESLVKIVDDLGGVP
jgi:hypothetical protein